MGLKLPGPRPTTTASVGSETYINVDHPSYAGNIQAAIDAHTAGTVFLPASATVRDITARVNVPANFSIVGEGQNASIVRMASSPGAAVAAMGASTGTGTYYYSKYRGFTLRGPRHGLSQTYGAAAQTNCYGLELGRRSKVEDVIVSGFESNFVILADHVDMERCWGDWGYHNVRYKSTSPDQRWQDQNYNECDFTGSYMSGVFCEDGTVVGSKFTNVHFGFQPYCFLAATGRTSPTGFINGSTFIACNWEAYGTAVAWSPNATDLFTGNTFIRCTGNQSATYLATSTTFDYAFYCGIIEKNLFIGGDTVTGSSPAVAFFGSPATTGNWFSSNRFDRANTPAAQPTTRRFAYRASDNAAPVISRFDSLEWRGRVVKCSSAVTAGALVRPTGRDSVAVLATNTQAVAGVAFDSCNANETIRIVENGYIATMTANGTVAAGGFIEPATHASGRVVAATGTAAIPPIGVALTAGVLDGTFQAMLRLGGGLG